MSRITSQLATQPAEVSPVRRRACRSGCVPVPGPRLPGTACPQPRTRVPGVRPAPKQAAGRRAPSAGTPDKVEWEAKELRRPEKFPEGSGNKLSSTVSELTGVSFRAMLEAPVNGEQDP